DWIVDKVYDYKRGYADLHKPGQAKWLQDDYVKFLRYSEYHIVQAGVGILGFITNHSWLDNPTFKGMRAHLLRSFSRHFVMDLHGNANKQGAAAVQEADKNVFEIKQGVAIALLRRVGVPSGSAKQVVSRSDLIGGEDQKQIALLQNTVRTSKTVSFNPIPPEVVFVPLDSDRKSEYEAYRSIADVMSYNGDPAPGIVTTHRSEEHTSELQSRENLVCRLLLE